MIFLNHVRGKQNSDKLKIDLETFKTKILVPVFDTLNKRGLAAQARVIAYSADFPTSVNIKTHTDKLSDPSLKQYQRATASITGLTYLYQFVIADNEAYLGWKANFYARGPFDRNFENPFVDQRRKEFDSAVSLLDADEFSEAAAAFEKLFKGSPTLSPLAIRAAEARAQNHEPAVATSLIRQAIKAGWTSGRYLRDSKVLSPLLEDPQIQRITQHIDDWPTHVQGPIGFSGAATWTPNGLPAQDPSAGVRYMMSCMLAVVHARGSSLDQAVKVFDRSSKSDRTFPQGSFWFTKSGDVRTKARLPFIGDALLWLKPMGHDAEIIHRPIPQKDGSVVGLMLGTPNMERIPKQKWKFVPGAISENLTSVSAHFGADAQTKITELLHAGVAMSSGSVAEPFAIHTKFPKPMMYGYYASGVTAIEAYYLTLSCPYQTLVVGDPITQPFARAPSDWVKLIPAAPVGDKPQLLFSRGGVALSKRQTNTVSIEFYLEGKLARAIPVVANAKLNLPSHIHIAGEFEASVVLIGGDSTRPRMSHHQSITIAGPLAVPTAKPIAGTHRISLSCQGADTLRLMHHQEFVGEVKGEQGEVELDRNKFGDGPLRIRPYAQFKTKQVQGKTVIVR